MLITYPSPTLHDGAGISWTGTQITSLSGMRDGRAGGLTRLAWGGDGTTPASSEVIRASYTDEPVEGVRVAALSELAGRADRLGARRAGMTQHEPAARLSAQQTQMSRSRGCESQR